MLTVACVLKSGGIYDATWVSRLKAGVARHLPLKHRFVCLSDVDVPCERIPLEHDWPGWWSKIELFRLGDDPVLFFDLDTVIVGDLSDVASAALSEQFCILRDFYRLGDGLGSGVMSWSGLGSLWGIYDLFRRNPDVFMIRHVRGDQDYIEHFYARSASRRWMRRWQDILPGQIVSYKRHCTRGIPENARVVCLHGLPKFGDMPVNDEVRLAWEMAA